MNFFPPAFGCFSRKVKSFILLCFSFPGYDGSVPCGFYLRLGRTFLEGVGRINFYKKNPKKMIAVKINEKKPLTSFSYLEILMGASSKSASFGLSGRWTDSKSLARLRSDVQVQYRHPNKPINIRRTNYMNYKEYSGYTEKLRFLMR
jgi:hypothetical protein